VFLSASEGFSRANVNASVAESLDRARPVAEAAAAHGAPLRAYVSCVVACPFDGLTRPAGVARLVDALLELGAYEVSLGDTIGAGDPAAVRALLREVLKVAGPERLAGHFHDTAGQAIRCVETAMDHDVFAFDAAVAGLGGCPFAPGAPGNVDTRAVVARLAALGVRTGVAEEPLERAARIALALREGRAPPETELP
jgi:hydroxymethylglutaryl-CoA lyase